jgi:hypothetical protein
MPATSQEPSGRSALLDAGFSRKARVDERGCRRDIRSNGRIAVSRSSLRENLIRQKKQVFFVRCGSHGPQFHRAPRPSVKSGPDVFADALVPRGVLISWLPPCRDRHTFSPGSRFNGSGQARPSQAMFCSARHVVRRTNCEAGARHPRIGATGLELVMRRRCILATSA